MTLKELLEQHEVLEVELLELRRKQDANQAKRTDLAGQVFAMMQARGVAGGVFACDGKRYRSMPKRLEIEQDATPAIDPNQEV